MFLHDSLIFREGPTGKLVIAKEVWILNIRLPLNLAEKRKLAAFRFYSSLVSKILDETLMATETKQIGVCG